MKLPIGLCFGISFIICGICSMMLAEISKLICWIPYLGLFKLGDFIAQTFNGESFDQKKREKAFRDYIKGYYVGSIINVDKVLDNFIYEQKHWSMTGAETPLPNDTNLYLNFEQYLYNITLDAQVSPFRGNDREKLIAAEAVEMYKKYLKILILKRIMTAKQAEEKVLKLEAEI